MRPNALETDHRAPWRCCSAETLGCDDSSALSLRAKFQPLCCPGSTPMRSETCEYKSVNVTIRMKCDTMAFYIVFLVVSLLVNVLLRYYKHKVEPTIPSKAAQHELLQRGDQDYESDSDCSIATSDDWTIISRQYLTVYAFAMGADWLQVRRNPSSRHMCL